MSLETPPGSTTDCFRCGYNLHSIADDKPCPECGLLAGRSRRVTDELHETRPKWLASISRGVNFILLAIVLTSIWYPIEETLFSTFNIYIMYHFGRAKFSDIHTSFQFLGFFIAGSLLVLGVFLLTRPEGFKPSDDADRRRRFFLRTSSFVPVFALALSWLIAGGLFLPVWVLLALRPHIDLIERIILVLFTVGTLPLVLFLFFQLRAIARRARSAHLAEHCAIVAFGTSGTILISGIAIDQSWYKHFVNSSHFAPAALIATTLLLCSLFDLWSLYLLVRFAISFRRAARQLQTKWTRDDRALEAK